MVEELQSLKKQIKNGKLQPLPWSLDDLPITMSTSGNVESKRQQIDPVLRKAMCVMECLYNEDVREIQDKINFIIEQVQIVTANPETDASLGVVGTLLFCLIYF